MNIKVNNQIAVIADGATVGTLAKERELPDRGVAIAVNDRIVRRVDWTSCKLADGDEVTIITAAYGG